MTPTTKNLLILLGLVTVVFVGYFFFSQRDTLAPPRTENDAVFRDMLTTTDVFIVRAEELSKINYNTSVLEDPRFYSLRGFSDTLEDQPAGKTDLFSGGSDVTE